MSRLGLAELESLAEPGLVELLVRKRLLISSMSRRRVQVRLAHPVYGDVLRSQIPPLRVRVIARALAASVEATGARRREDTLRVATWSLEGGIQRPGIMLSAARTARWRYDFDLADRLVTGAIDGGAGFEAALLAAQIAILQGHLREAEEQLAALAAGSEHRRRARGGGREPDRRAGGLSRTDGRRVANSPCGRRRRSTTRSGGTRSPPGGR